MDSTLTHDSSEPYILKQILETICLLCSSLSVQQLKQDLLYCFDSDVKCLSPSLNSFPTEVLIFMQNENSVLLSKHGYHQPPLCLFAQLLSAITLS